MLYMRYRIYFDRPATTQVWCLRSRAARARMRTTENHAPGRASSTPSQSTKPERRQTCSWFSTTLLDLRLAARSLCKSPAFAVTAILTLALGIGVNAAIFQLLDAVRMRSLPVTDPQALATVQIQGGNRGFGISGDGNVLTFPLWEQIRDHQQIFSGTFAWRAGSVRVGQREEDRRARALWVTGDTFATLGVYPVRGHLLNAEDDRPGCGTPGVILSYAFWQNEFGGQDSALGAGVMIEHRLTRVLGVTPPRFFGLEVGKSFDFVLPLCSVSAYKPEDDSLRRRDYFSLTVMGRLKPDWTLQHASEQLDSISPGVVEATVPTGYSAEYLDLYRHFRLRAYSAYNGVSSLRDSYDTSLWLLFAITAMVLLIACANLANLMLARANTRSREMAVRLALGASRWRLIRQLLVEGALLAACGAVLGAVLSTIFSRGILAVLSTQNDALQLDLRLDWRILAFTTIVALITCSIFDLLPALRASRTDPGNTLKTSSRGSTAGKERFSFQRVLVVSQIAVSLVLLVGALLFVRSFRNLVTFDPGFHQDGIIVAFLSLSNQKVASDDAYDPAMQNLLESLETIPGVNRAASSTHILLDGSSWSLGVTVDATQGSSKFTWVSPAFFHTIDVPILDGRGFNARDTRASPCVIIVNQMFVRKFFGAANPLGKIVRTAPEPQYPSSECEVVGVAKDARYSGLRDPVFPEVFGPATQFPPGQAATYLFLRSSLPAAQMIPALRQGIAEFAPESHVEFRIFRDEVQNSLVRERMMALLSGSFGALAALLTTVGLYGVISYIVAMRRNEIGIRMALGASRQRVVGAILGQTLQMLALGVAAGILLSLAATRGAASLLFGLQPSDPLSMIAATTLLVAVAVIAGYLPAHRASRIEPCSALRYE
jgi:predicted permease